MSGTPTTPDDPAEPHAYLRVRPTGHTLTGNRVTEQCEQLHGAVDTPIECLLVGDPATDEVRYYLGTPPDTRPVPKRVLARLLPDTYAVEPIEGDPLTNVFDVAFLPSSHS